MRRATALALINGLPITFHMDDPRRVLKELRIQRVRLTQHLSEAFELDLLVTTQDHNLALDKLIGERTRVEFAQDTGLRKLHGLISRVQQTSARIQDDVTYEFKIVPQFWVLSKRTQQRIFKDLTAVGVVQKLMKEHGLDAPRVQPFRGNHPIREYLVQHRETDYDFARRLLAEEGISFWFDHDSSSELTLADDTTSMSPLRTAPIPYRPDLGGLSSADHIQGLTVTRAVRPGTAVVRDYSFENPLHVLEGKAFHADAAEREQTTLDFYEYQVGEFSDDVEGGRRAVQVMEEERADARVLSCRSSLTISPGTRFVVTGHPRDDVDGELLVVSARLEWALGESSGSEIRTDDLSCIPGATPFRPRRLEKPRIWGSQSAIVMCPEGKEIDVDKHGRVNVMFRWDRRNLISPDASRRVRVSQGWAGANYGFMMVPRVGNEVLVGYLDGDPDEPVIVGRVHNGFNVEPLALPAEQSQSIWKSKTTPEQPTESFNMIRMEDNAGSELLELRAQRDFRSEALRNADTKIGVDHSLTVGGTSNNKISGGFSLSSASTNIGTGPYKVRCSEAEIQSGSHIDLLAADRRKDASANHQIATGGLWVNASAVVQVVAPTIKFMAGSSSITLTQGEIRIESAGPVIVNGAPIKLNC